MKYLFLDTNIYLHYKNFEQLNWAEILSSSEDVTIVVPPITLNEIDKIKDRGTGKVNGRARNTAKRFREVFLEGKDTNIPMEHCNGPKPADFDTYTLDKEIADNHFVLSALLYQQKCNRSVIIVAADTNPLLTAKTLGLEYKYLPDEYRLQPELSQTEKELFQVKKELEQFKNRKSNPIITFANKKAYLKIRKPAQVDADSMIKKQIEEEWKRIPYYTEKDNARPSNPSAIAVAYMLRTPKLPQTDIERYNAEVKEYHKEFEEYARLKFEQEALNAQMFEIKLQLTNNGNAPTGNLDIFIYFPENINLYDTNSQKSVDIEIVPLEPEKPSMFSSPLSREIRRQKHYRRNESIANALFGYEDNRPKMWDMNKIIKERDFKFSKDALSQTLTYELKFPDKLYVNLFQCNSFRIGYIIVDGTLPNRIEGVLNVVVE